MYTCTVDLSGFYDARDRMMAELERGLSHSAETAAREGVATAKAGHFKDRTGELRRQIHAEKLVEAARGSRWKIVAPLPYAIFVEAGTREHEIWPKAANRFVGPLRPSQTRRATGKGPHEHIVGRGLALRWKVGGTVFFARYVHHPGSRAYPFMGPAALTAERVLYRELELLRNKLGTVWQRAA